MWKTQNMYQQQHNRIINKHDFALTDILIFLRVIILLLIIRIPIHDFEIWAYCKLCILQYFYPSFMIKALRAGIRFVTSKVYSESGIL